MVIFILEQCEYKNRKVEHGTEVKTQVATNPSKLKPCLVIDCHGCDKVDVIATECKGKFLVEQNLQCLSIEPTLYNKKDRIIERIKILIFIFSNFQTYFTATQTIFLFSARKIPLANLKQLLLKFHPLSYLTLDEGSLW